MTSDTLRNAIEQNHNRLKAILDELEIGHKMDPDPKTKADRTGFFTPDEKAKEAGLDDVEMSDEERLAWKFEQNMKAIDLVPKLTDEVMERIEGILENRPGNSPFLSD